MARKTKGNKGILESVHYASDLIAKIKSGENLKAQERSEILSRFCGFSRDNNSYFTPPQVCKFIVDAIKSKNGTWADLSAGIGNMIAPLIQEYGKMDCDSATLYELDENNGLACQEAWKDYQQVSTHFPHDSIANASYLPQFDYVIGNPPFCGDFIWPRIWNGNNNKQKCGSISIFTELSIEKTRPGGFTCLLFPHQSLKNCQDKRPEQWKWITGNSNLMAVIHLDSDIFKDSGVKGTKVGTSVHIWKREQQQGQVLQIRNTPLDSALPIVRAWIHEGRKSSFNNNIRYVDFDKQSEYWKPRPNIPDIPRIQAKIRDGKLWENILSGLPSSQPTGSDITCELCGATYTDECYFSTYAQINNKSQRNICIECENDYPSYLLLLKLFLLDNEIINLSEQQEYELAREIYGRISGQYNLSNGGIWKTVLDAAKKV